MNRLRVSLTKLRAFSPNRVTTLFGFDNIALRENDTLQYHFLAQLHAFRFF